MIEFRFLRESDYDRGFIDVLSHLTNVGRWDPKKWKQHFARYEEDDRRLTVVAHCAAPDLIVGTASMILEEKFIHGGRLLAHLEDVVVLPTSRRQNVATTLVQTLVDWARNREVYKIRLTCKAENVTVYESMGFFESGSEMCMRCYPFIPAKSLDVSVPELQ